jgi:hypothetical protein
VITARVTHGSGESFGVWRETTSGLELVGLENSVATADFPYTFDQLGGVSMNSNGLLAISAYPSSSTSTGYVFAERPDGSWRIAAQTQQPIPGTSETLAHFYFSHFNAQGYVALNAYLTNSPPGGALPTSVWAEDALGLKLVARAGESAVGAGAAVFEGFENLQFNDHGDLLFEAYLTPGIGGVTSNNDQGLWLRRRDGRLILIAREGDELDIAPGPASDLRRIFFLDSIANYADLWTQRRMLTNRGEVLFYAEFHDGSSGLFLTERVPEPSALALAIIAVTAYVGRMPRTRQRVRVLVIQFGQRS